MSHEVRPPTRKFYADFARIICLEPANQQEAYEMTREAFDLSEKFHIQVMVRLVTRLAHSRSVVHLLPARPENPIIKPAELADWTLLPANARRRWRSLIERQADFLAYSEACVHNGLMLNNSDSTLGVITTGLARNYFLENLDDLTVAPSHLHIGAYPLPFEKIRQLAVRVERVLVLEEGQPFLERLLRGIVSPHAEICGRQSGHIPPDGELTPDIVRAALGLQLREQIAIPSSAWALLLAWRKALRKRVRLFDIYCTHLIR